MKSNSSRTKLSVEHRVIKCASSHKMVSQRVLNDKKENKQDNSTSSTTNNYFSFGINAKNAPQKREQSRN